MKSLIHIFTFLIITISFFACKSDPVPEPVIPLNLLSLTYNGIVLDTTKTNNDIAIDKSFIAEFNVSIDTNSLSQLITLKDENENFVILNFDFGSNNRKIYIIPKDDLIPATNYSLNFSNNLKSTSGEKFHGLIVSLSTIEEPLADNEIMDIVQLATFKYFWECIDPTSGLAYKGYPDNNGIIAIGGDGMGVLAMIAGINRGFVSREEVIDRLLQICNYLDTIPARYHGAWSHWIDGSTGEQASIGRRGGDIVETAFMIQGLLTAREYFEGTSTKEENLRTIITKLWEEVEWDWFVQGNTIMWHWSETEGYTLPIVGFNEAQIIYILAIASPTHPVDPSLYDLGWAGGNYDRNFISPDGPTKGGPLFFTHYSYLALTPYFRDKYCDQAGYSSHFERNRIQVNENRNWCINNNTKYDYYNENCWGLTAGATPSQFGGYKAHAPKDNLDVGTITVTAAIASMPYEPEKCLAATKYFYDSYKENLWDKYGFKDGFNLSTNPDWYANNYIIIDQGPIMVMIENYRSGLLWNNFMKNPEIHTALAKIGATLVN